MIITGKHLHCTQFDNHLKITITARKNSWPKTEVCGGVFVYMNKSTKNQEISSVIKWRLQYLKFYSQ